VRYVNGAELYSLGQKLMAVAADALPAESVLRRISPAARVVLDDVAQHPGTALGEIAERTGLSTGQVSALVEAMTADDFVEITAKLGTADSGAVREVTGVLAFLARRLGTGRGLGARIDEITPATLEVTVDPAGVRAWRTAITRV
jgi:hypothetical protein